MKFYIRSRKRFLKPFKGSEIIPTFIKDLPVKRQGDGHYLAICPFHNERTPSLRITPRKDIYHCMGCGVSNKLKPDPTKQTNMNDLRSAIQFIKKMDDLNHKWNQTFAEEINNLHEHENTQNRFVQDRWLSGDAQEDDHLVDVKVEEVPIRSSLHNINDIAQDDIPF